MTAITVPTDFVGWYAILTQPQRETAVVDRLARHGVYSFFPVEKRWRVRRLQRKHPSGKVMPDGRTGYYVERPVLPGYIFAKIPGEPRWHIIKDLPHISGVLGHNGRPIRLHFDDMQTLYDLRQRADDADGVTEASPQIAFKPGDQVRITEHAGLEGFVSEVMAVDAANEVVYLRDLLVLGRELPVSIANLVKM